jgi:hypothetical protein
MNPTVAPGYKTTEFWVTLATSVGGLAAAAAGFLPGKAAIVATSVSVSAYAVSRAVAKFGGLVFGIFAPKQ